MENKDYDFDDAIAFIGERCQVDRVDIEQVLELEIEYLMSIGLAYEVKEE